MRYLVLLVSFLVVSTSWTQTSKVEVAQNGASYQLMVDGEPYYVKGVGGHVQLDAAVKVGANTIRTWGLENAKARLDEAHEKGLKVMMGIWMAHERHGFDYSNNWATQDQLKGVRQAVLELKDHPALLMWGVGNEVDLFYSDFNVWHATENIAKMIHEVDPNHPTCAVTAGIDVAEIQLIKMHAPSIDILGINTYGAIGTLKDQIDLYGWDKPYLVTEWGPTGHWEVQKTPWGASVEESSTEKAKQYRNRYLTGIAADEEQCMGSFVFLWGQKQETTPTWYGVFLESGLQTEALDVLEEVWTGEAPANKAPQIQSFTINEQDKTKDVTLSKGDPAVIRLDFSDADNNVKVVRWEVLPESTDIKAGGDVEDRPEAILGLVKFNKLSGEGTLTLPNQIGAYRLFVYVEDTEGKAATSNIPFYIN
ncbi:MAG: glycoside hydrolase family 2 TIM barrel-domain containing protein [Bacteroidota bacterium]